VGDILGIMEITTALPPEDLAELDRVCRYQGVSRPDAVDTALRWYIGREGDLPPIEDPTADEIEP
jgi:metal-responsive CopG/Arc/MetJ family transcriptional regulator